MCGERQSEVGRAPVRSSLYISVWNASKWNPSSGACTAAPMTIRQTPEVAQVACMGKLPTILHAPRSAIAVRGIPDPLAKLREPEGCLCKAGGLIDLRLRLGTKRVRGPSAATCLAYPLAYPIGRRGPLAIILQRLGAHPRHERPAGSNPAVPIGERGPAARAAAGPLCFPRARWSRDGRIRGLAESGTGTRRQPRTNRVRAERPELISKTCLTFRETSEDGRRPPQLHPAVPSWSRRATTLSARRGRSPKATPLHPAVPRSTSAW